MATYEIKTVTVTTTPTVVVAADSDVDRVVHLVAGSSSSINWSFDGVESSKIAGSAGIDLMFALPADEALHAWTDVNPASVGLIVTKV